MSDVSELVLHFEGTHIGMSLSHRMFSVTLAIKRIQWTAKLGRRWILFLVQVESSSLEEQWPLPSTLGKYSCLLATTQSLPVAKVLALRAPKQEAETTSE